MHGQIAGTDAARTLAVATFRVVRAMKSHRSMRHDPQTILLLRIVRDAPHPMSVGDLAANVRLDASTVSRHVKNLEEAGYLTRQADAADRRTSRLAVTAAGSVVLEDALALSAAELAQAVTEWSDRDVATLAALMTRLAEDMERR